MRSDKSNFRQEVVHGLLAVAMLLISLSFSIKVYADDNVPTYTESQLDDATAYVRKQLIDRKTDFSLTIELSNADIALTEAQTTELQSVKSDSAKFSSAVSIHPIFSFAFAYPKYAEASFGLSSIASSK